MLRPPHDNSEVILRGAEKASGSLFTGVNPEARRALWHPLRNVRHVVIEAEVGLDATFEVEPPRFTLLRQFRCLSGVFCER